MLCSAAMLSWPAVAPAQDIHKCVDKGRVIYQAAPCAHADVVLRVQAAAPTASDAQAAASRAQADKDAAAAAASAVVPSPDVVGAPAVDPCRSLSAQYGEALRNRDLLDREPLQPTPRGAPPSAMNNARGQASEQLRSLEALMRASNCRVARP